MVKLKQLSAFSATLGFWNVAYHCEKGYYAEGMITQKTLLSEQEVITPTLPPPRRGGGDYLSTLVFPPPLAGGD